MPKTVYLGDGVYARYENDFNIIIYTSDGITDSNHIYLEAGYVKGLYDFVERIRQEPRK